MKNIRYALLIVVALVVGACTDMLDQLPLESPLPDNFFSNEAEANQGVNAVYGRFTTNKTMYHRAMIGFELLSDNAWHGADDQVYGKWMYFNITPEDPGVLEFYESLYQIINRANIAISKISELTFEDDPDNIRRDNLIGQVHFLRGYANFLLTLIYGEAPLIEELTLDPSGNFVVKSSAEDIYNYVIAELKKAKDMLPEKQSELGRITKGAATGMLAKVYLFGADELNKPEWYAFAKTEAEQVINSGKYGLLSTGNPVEDFKSIFTPAQENGKEIMFSIQHSMGEGYSDEASLMVMSTLPRINKSFIWGFGNTCINPEIGDPSFWENGDARREVTIWSNGEVDDKGNVFNIANQARPTVRPDAYGCKKYFWFDPANPAPSNSSFDWIVLRYADLLLVHAEADLMAGGTISSNGLKSLNEVRQRAGLPAKSSVTRNEILNERQYELMGELHRWWDLMRTHTAEQAFAKLKTYPDKAGFNAARHYKFPIPARALERNEALIQHPAWAASAE